MKRFISVFLSLLMVLSLGAACLADGESTDGPEEEPADAPEAEEFDPAAYDTGITYRQMRRAPDKYKDQNVTLSGTVLQVLELVEENQGILLMDEDSTEGLYFSYDPEALDFTLEEEEHVTLYGVAAGEFTYESVTDKQVTLPYMQADWIEITEKPEPTPSPAPSPTPAVEETPAPETPAGFDEEEVISQLDIRKLHYYNIMNNDLLVVTNNSEYDLVLGVDAMFYDAEDKLVGVTDREEHAVGAGQSVVFWFTPDEEYVRAQYKFKASEEAWYEPVAEDLSYEDNMTDDKVILSVTNNGSEAAEFVQGTVLFYNGGSIVGFDTTYFTDDEFEIKPGETIHEELYCFEAFDSYEVYLTGRR